MKRAVIALGVLAIMSAGCVNANIPTVTPRPTPTAKRMVTSTLESLTAATSVQVNDIEALPGDPVEGERLFQTFQPRAGTTCTACHLTDSDDRLIGPGLKSVGIRAQTRVAGQSASQYLYTSIVDPAAYVVEGYPNLMPKNWGNVFTEAQVDDLVAYLISLSRG